MSSSPSRGTCACSEGVKLVACTMVKNEMAYLPEWIAHHRAIGIQKFVIYDDGSSDGVASLPQLYSTHNVTVDLQVLPAPQKAAFTEATFTDGMTGHQEATFTDCLDRNRDATWVGVFDVDEFIVLKSPPKEPCGSQDSLKCLLKEVTEGQVYFQGLRFSSIGQKRDFNIRLNGARSSKPMTIENPFPLIDEHLVEQHLNCSDVGLSEDVIHVKSPPCLKIGGKKIVGTDSISDSESCMAASTKGFARRQKGSRRKSWLWQRIVTLGFVQSRWWEVVCPARTLQ